MRRRALAGLMMLSSLAGDAPPAEFRVFASGWNATTKGRFLFDDEAARAVMADYARHGVDNGYPVMIDLEHLSLDEDSRNFDPDARGWARLELRNGDLWAVVKWSPDGEARLRDKRQRFISPAFTVDPKTKRVLRLINVAITALPATDQLTPLVAATKTRSGMLNPKLLELLGLPPDADDEAAAEALTKDPAKILADLSSAFDAMDADPDADADADAPGKPAGAPPAGGAPAATAQGAPVKKVTTEYHRVAKDRAITTQLASELRDVQAKLAEREVRDIILANRKKFTPGLEQWALTQSPEDLLVWLKAQPELVTAGKPREPQKAAAEAVELSPEERKMCRDTGTNPVELLAHKKKIAAAAAEELA